jgi:hypothetical protein
MECKCDAQWSGKDEAMYCAFGCPSCTCGMIEDECDIIHAMQPISFDEVMQRVEDDRKARQQQSMDEHMVKTSSAKKL